MGSTEMGYLWPNVQENPKSMSNRHQVEWNPDRNEDEMRLLISRRNRLAEQIERGGGPKRIAKLHEEGKMTARERIDYLLDSDAPQFELGTFAGYEMYEEYGGCPAGGVVVKLGYISGRLVIVVANDATVKAGAWFPITAKKNLRAQEIAMENHIPIIYLVDSAGVFLPLQDEVFPDKEHFGRIFRNNAVMSAKGVPQIAAIMGSCVAGGAYLPIMSDESLIVEGTGSIFLAGPHLVRAAIGEVVDKETLGGAYTQTAISGIVDYRVQSDAEALDLIKKLVAQLGHPTRAGFDRAEPKAPRLEADEILRRFPVSRIVPYAMEEVLECIVDDAEWIPYKADYGKTILCAFARIDGWAVGIVANDRRVVKTAKGQLQVGGVIYSDSADKAARFVMLCNQKRIPLVFFHDVTGFMVGKDSEHGGIIKDGAKLVNAVANSTVPKISIVAGSSYGAGNYAMCGRAYDPRLMLAWPTAKIAVMGGEQAAKVLTQIQIQNLKKQGIQPDEQQQQQIFNDIAQRYESQTSPYYAAARLWVDEIIDPRHTRQYISMAIEMADHRPVEQFSTGVLQT